jgi:CheY-like chemotaxis protein
MRPKKVILCVDDNEQDLSVLKFLLQIKGYRVLETSHPEEATAIFLENFVDLVIADSKMPGIDGDQLIGKLKQITSRTPMMLLGDPKKDMVIHADALVCKRTTSPTELCERVKIMSARKRGPRPGRSIKLPSLLKVCLA